MNFGIVGALTDFHRQNLFFFRLTGRPVITIDGNRAEMRSATVEIAARAPTVKTTDDKIRPLAPEALDGEAQAFFHHGVNVVGIARLRAISLASGNRWPSPADHEARARAESDRCLEKRYPSSADTLLTATAS